MLGISLTVTDDGKYIVAAESGELLYWNVQERTVIFQVLKYFIVGSKLLLRGVVNFCTGTCRREPLSSRYQ
jgi:hypothetical protein